jgi:hypothetical protein
MTQRTIVTRDSQAELGPKWSTRALLAVFVSAILGGGANGVPCHPRSHPTTGSQRPSDHPHEGDGPHTVDKDSAVIIDYTAHVVGKTDAVILCNSPRVITSTKLNHQSMIRGLQEGLYGVLSGSEFELQLPHSDAYHSLGLWNEIPPGATIAIRGTVTIPRSLTAGLYEFDQEECADGIEYSWSSALPHLRSMYIREGIHSEFRLRIEEAASAGTQAISSEQGESGDWAGCPDPSAPCVDSKSLEALCFLALVGEPLWDRHREISRSIDRAVKVVSDALSDDVGVWSLLENDPVLWLWVCAGIMEAGVQRPTVSTVRAEQVVRRYLLTLAEGSSQKGSVLSRCLRRRPSSAVACIAVLRTLGPMQLGDGSDSLITALRKAAVCASQESASWNSKYLVESMTQGGGETYERECLGAYWRTVAMSEEDLLHIGLEGVLELSAWYSAGSPFWENIESTAIHRICSAQLRRQGLGKWNSPRSHCSASKLVTTAHMVLALQTYNRCTFSRGAFMIDEPTPQSSAEEGGGR